MIINKQIYLEEYTLHGWARLEEFEVMTYVHSDCSIFLS